MITTAINKPPALKGITIPAALQGDLDALCVAIDASDRDIANLESYREEIIVGLLDPDSDVTSGADLNNRRLQIRKAHAGVLGRCVSLAGDLLNLTAQLTSDARRGLTEAQAACEAELAAMGWSPECMPSWSASRQTARREYARCVIASHPTVAAARAEVDVTSKAGRRAAGWAEAVAHQLSAAREELTELADGLAPQ